MTAVHRSAARRAAALCALGLGLAGSVLAAGNPLRFEISFAASVRGEPADGRIFVMISSKKDPEPRLTARGYRATPFFGEDVEGLRPGAWAAVTASSDGYPLPHLSDIPPGDYWVQGFLNVYTTFSRADGHVVKMHMDQWEGQHFQVSPGNLYSEPRRMRLDPASGGAVRLVLDKKIPPIDVPADTALVKHVRFQSALLSKFWGHPIWIGATILLPRDYEKESGVSYPVLYEQGHFSTDAPGGFGEEDKSPADATDAQKARALQRKEFDKAWLSDRFPRMLFVTFQHPTPYYDDSYAIDTPNNGPYGQALTAELIPYIEAHFRAIAQPWARILSGGSTGGWESLALQIFHPDFFGGTFSACPDPVDFHNFQIVNIYDWDNAWYRQEEWKRVPLPGERDSEGVVLSTMEQQLKYERALGNHGRSGEDWDCWQAVYGPVGQDGYFQPLFDPNTGAIDKKVAAYWKEHTDLNVYLQKHWAELGAKLAGKIHITAGEMDTFYLNNAVHRLEDFLRTANPPGAARSSMAPASLTAGAGLCPRRIDSSRSPSTPRRTRPEARIERGGGTEEESAICDL